MTDHTPAGLPDHSSRSGNGLFLSAMIIIGAALLVGGPVTVLSQSKALLDATIALGLIGIVMVIVAAILSFINTPRR